MDFYIDNFNASAAANLIVSFELLLGFHPSDSAFLVDRRIFLTTPETAQLQPISNYGIFKLFCEMIIQHYSEMYGMGYAIVRFANVTGGRSEHGIVHDFVKKLNKDPRKLEILGNGKQEKSYIYHDDAVSALVLASKLKKNEIFNAGSTDTVSVNEIAGIITKTMHISPKYAYKDRMQGRGWTGDVRKMRLSTRKAESLGWKPSRSSKETIKLSAMDSIRNQFK